MSSIKQEQSVLITAMLLSLFWIGKLIVLISLLVEHIFDMNFEERFFKHFTTLGTCFEVHVSLNINQCLSSETSKVTISLFYDGKFSKKCKLEKRGWQLPCEIATYLSDVHYSSILFNREFAYATSFKFDDDWLTRSIYCLILLLMKQKGKRRNHPFSFQNFS